MDDPAILDAQKTLASKEGLLCEPTAAVVIAALAHHSGGGRNPAGLPDVTPDTRVCCIVTGNGIKDLAGLEKRAAPPISIGPSIEELERAFQRV